MSITPMERWLIVNADDFGLSEGVNRGVLRARREGVLTSASLMVRQPAAVDAVGRAEDLDLGLHLDLGEWTFDNGQWTPLYERVSLDDADAVESEVHRQLEEFQRQTGKAPTHIDSHQHVHLHEPVLSAARRLADRLSVPLRACTPRIRYCGSFYGQSGEGAPCAEAISLTALIELLADLPPGITELGCHPGEDGELRSTYVHQRRLEVQVLCDPRVRQTIAAQNIRLCSFVDLAPAKP